MKRDSKSALSSSTDLPLPDSSLQRIPVGYVAKAHGITGSVLVRPLTDSPEARFVAGATFQTDESPTRGVVITQVRSHKKGILVDLDVSNDRGTAESLQGVTLTISRAERRSLGPDEYWEESLVGLAVVDVRGNLLGAISGVVFGVGQDRLAVATEDGRRIEVPFVAPLVPEVRSADGVVVVDPPAGLFD